MQKTQKEHYVPVMYYRNFYAKEDNVETNSLKDLLTCYYVGSNKPFNDNGRNIAHKRNLYEYSNDEKFVNDIENKFSSNVERPMKSKFDELLRKSYEINKSYELDKENAYDFCLYISTQMFRHPKTMPFMFQLLLNVASRESGLEFKHTQENLNEAKRILMTEISNLHSEWNTKTADLILNKHKVLIIKSEKIHFFTSDMPIFMNAEVENYNQVTFDKIDFYFPLNPDFCMAIISENTMILSEEENDEDVTIDTLTRALLGLALLSSNLIVSDGLTDEFINTINEAYVGILKEKEKIEAFRKTIKI